MPPVLGACWPTHRHPSVHFPQDAWTGHRFAYGLCFERRLCWVRNVPSPVRSYGGLGKMQILQMRAGREAGTWWWTWVVLKEAVRRDSFSAQGIIWRPGQTRKRSQPSEELLDVQEGHRSNGEFWSRGTSLAVWWLGLVTSTAGGVSLNPSRWTRILQTLHSTPSHQNLVLVLCGLKKKTFDDLPVRITVIENIKKKRQGLLAPRCLQPTSGDKTFIKLSKRQGRSEKYCVGGQISIT